jgi:hypothetical protein
MGATNRRYDIDWVRVIGIGLLLIYHLAVGFQSWGLMVGFIVNSTAWESLWIPMAMLNVWRIPLLFFVSGMGVYFALQNRNLTQLLTERAGRILLPFIFGIFTIAPLQLYILQYYYTWPIRYIPVPAHLWFLGNIAAYIILLLPLFYAIKNYPESWGVNQLKKLFSTPWGLVVVPAVFVIEALLVKPTPYEMYALTWHGFYLGFLAFTFGLCCVTAGTGFWAMLLKYRLYFLVSAVSLFSYRLLVLELVAPAWQLAIESVAWVYTVFAFSFRYLNRPSKLLQYLSKAAYPVYILHMVFLTLGSLLIFPLQLAVYTKFALVLLFTLVGSFACYEYFICRVNFVKPLFGLVNK